MFSTLKNMLPLHFPTVEFTDGGISEVDFKQYQIFAIVRNPYYRSVSCYMDKCYRNPSIKSKMPKASLQYCQKQLLEALMELRGTTFNIAPPDQIFTESEHPNQRALLNENFRILSELEFEEYAYCIPLILDKKSVDGHFAIQYNAFKVGKKNLIHSDNHLSQPIKILKMESLAQDWQSVHQLINIEMPLKRFNATFGKSKDEYYTENVRKVIHNSYKIDFDVFKYDSVI